jgi:hypothetical protein
VSTNAIILFVFKAGNDNIQSRYANLFTLNEKSNSYPRRSSLQFKLFIWTARKLIRLSNLAIRSSVGPIRKMLALCDSYADKYHSANKSKCLILFPSTRRFLCGSLKSCAFFIGDKPIEFVNLFSHLGHLTTDKLSDSSDVLKRRSDFVDQVNNVLCYFGKLTSCVKNRQFQSDCTSLYECELWLHTDEIDSLCVSWRKSLHRA